MEMRTKDGKPWVRWSKDGYTGWKYPGMIDIMFPSRIRNDWLLAFFSVVFQTAVGFKESNKYDSVHCVGEGVLYLGPLGFDLKSGRAQKLYSKILQSNPEDFMDCMGPLMVSESFFFRGEDFIKEGKSCDLKDIARIIRRGSDGVTWTPAQKDCARRWVSNTVTLLQKVSYNTYVRALKNILTSELSEESKERVSWREDVQYSQWTIEKNRMWAYLFVYGALTDKESMNREAYLLSEGREHALPEVFRAVQQYFY